MAEKELVSSWFKPATLWFLSSHCAVTCFINPSLKGFLCITVFFSSCCQHEHKAWFDGLIKAAFFDSRHSFLFFHCHRCATSYLHLNTRCRRGFAFSVPFFLSMFDLFHSFFLFLSLLSTFEKRCLVFALMHRLV